jgi:methylthioribose-1-phosphate isomerase
MLPPTLQWIGQSDGSLRLIDQTRLPESLEMIDCETPQDAWHAIKRLSVRGAPAIGVAAAYGVVLALRKNPNDAQAALDAADYLATSRPTAVNLFWALDRMRRRIAMTRESDGSLADALLDEAMRIHREDSECCRRIGVHGAPLLGQCDGVLTHCNAGGLATSQYGTALSVIYEAHRQNPGLRVWADETRPLLQGARLTAWELQQSGVAVEVICDSAAAHFMRQGQIQAVIVGADRIAANGDVANKVGTYGVAIAARYHNIPFYVAAPLSTFDLTLDSGDQIPIEQRDAVEVAVPFGRRVVPDGVAVGNPAFDVTPAELITALITDAGVIESVDRQGIAAHVAAMGNEETSIN